MPEVLLRALDVFVISSTTEATPNSLLEAMACGLPAVCTDVGDIRDMLGKEAESSLTQSGDLSAFAAALVDQALSGRKRRRAGEANRPTGRRAAFGREHDRGVRSFIPRCGGREAAGPE